MTVSRVFFYLAPPSQLSKIVTPLLRLLPISKEISRITLANLSIIIDEIPVSIVCKSQTSTLLILFFSFI